MYVCVCVCVYVYIIYICMYIYIYVCVCVCVCVCDRLNYYSGQTAKRSRFACLTQGQTSA